MGFTVYPAPTSGGANPKSIAEFTASGTYVVPAGCTWLYVTAVGGGGGGGRGTSGDFNGVGGCSGYVVQRWVEVTGGSSHSVTIGAGGTGETSNNNGGTGGTTSLGSLISAAGATASSNGTQGKGQNPPPAINLRGSGTTLQPFGGGAGASGYPAPGTAVSASDGVTGSKAGGPGGGGYGAGGGGGGTTSSGVAAGGNGAQGYLVVVAY